MGILNLEDTKIKASSSDAMLVSLSVADRTQNVIGQLILARPPQEYVREAVIG